MCEGNYYKGSSKDELVHKMMSTLENCLNKCNEEELFKERKNRLPKSTTMSIS